MIPCNEQMENRFRQIWTKRESTWKVAVLCLIFCGVGNMVLQTYEPTYLKYNWILPNLTCPEQKTIFSPMPGSDEKQKLPYYSMAISRNILDRYQEYLHLKPIQNISALFKNKYCDVVLENKAAMFVAGSEVTVYIRLYNGFGHALKQGGDFLHIWLRNKDGKSAVAGYVIDNMDGTYTGKVTAYWAGNPYVKVSVANTKESIGLYTNYVQEHGSYKFTNATFIEGKRKEMTQCSPSPVWINKTYGGVCNLTSENFNITFFCGKPKTIPCSTWKLYGWDGSLYYDRHTTDILRYRNIILKEIPITVLPSNNMTVNYSVPNTPCHRLSKSITWSSVVPSGFLYQGRYYNLLCELTIPQDVAQYKRCLRNKPVVSIGDSTTRQWFFRLTSFMKMNVTKAATRNRAWQKLVTAKDQHIGLNLEWQPHEHPFHGTPGSDRKNLKSVSWRLDQIPANSTAIVIIHWYAHIARCCNHVDFREHVRAAKAAIVRLLNRSPEVQVFIKGPHYIAYYNALKPYSYVAKFVQQVLYEEFKNLQDKIVYLDQWDMSVAMENVNIHPLNILDDISLNTLINFSCMLKQSDKI